MIYHFNRIPTTSRCGKSFLILSMCCLLFPFVVNADPDFMEYRAEAYRTYQSIEIDGEFNEEDWQNAKTITRLIQYEPAEGELISQPTEIRILYDAQEIYFGFTCFDSDMSKMVANEMRRDGSGRDGLRENDHVSILLDTYNDRRNGFYFRVNPLGAKEDIALINTGESRNQAWDAIWECRTKINENHWTAEIGIPFSQLRFSKSDDMTWGLNLGRSLMRNQEDATWAPLSKAHGFFARYRTDVIGNLVGLEGITPSRNLELLPYILPGMNRIEEEKKTDSVFDIGLDLKYGITSNLTTDLTFNTDFAQVEADQEQVNLTRFSLFFPEKRPFFLEGAGLFDFGIPRTSFRRPPPLLLFYSRRIGLEEGRAIPIIGGGKITGKAGPYGIGMLNVLTNEFLDETDPDEIIDVSRTNYTVLRLTRDIFSGSRIGLIGINKQDPDAYNRATGFDFTYRPIESLDIRGLWARTFEAEVTGQNNALYVGSTWRNRDLRLEGSYTDIGENFNPEVGFIQREGIRRINGQMRYSPRLGKFGVRQIYTGPEFDFILNQDNQLETQEITLTNYFRFENGSYIGFLPKRTTEHLDEDFEIRDGIIIPLGEYNFTEMMIRGSTDDTKVLAGQYSVNFGNFYNGSRWGFTLNAGFKPNGRLNVQPIFQFNRVTLPQDAFNASIFGARVGYSFSTTLFAKVFAQWNSDDDIIATNILLNYIYRPGSDFYLVFNQIYDTGGTKTALDESTVVAKMTYWWNP
ncbi:hypothetical protein C6502_19300 [Candidatus Poribacteria bacterium]|nr:MAG: hypothetical protein C6502_19300 [Candidatus Poribacteria bacterium]